MPFEVLGLITRCSEVHGTHPSLLEAKQCLSDITDRQGGALRVHPMTGKYIHAIAKVDRSGNQIPFQKDELQTAEDLELNPKALLTHKPAVTSIYNLANLYCNAMGSIPMLSVNLDLLFEYEDRNRHFWATDTGRGQSLAYILQAAFTLELCLKAVLESCGRFAETPEDGNPDWKTHRPVELFDLLEDQEKQRLELWWKQRSLDERHFDGSYTDFLKSVDDLYMGARYLQRDLKGVNPQIEIASILTAARVALAVADRAFLDRFPIRSKATVHQVVDPDRPKIREVFMEGVVQSVSIPEGFDPHSQVEAVIVTDDGQEVTVNLFRKMEVEKYHGIEGTHVVFEIYVYESDPSVIHHAGLLHRSGPASDKPSYAQEQGLLSGSVYNLEGCDFVAGQRAVRLTLDDGTYFSKVECIFTAKAELEQLANVQLGQHVLVRGQISRRNGRPIIVLGPEILHDVTNE